MYTRRVIVTYMPDAATLFNFCVHDGSSSKFIQENAVQSESESFFHSLDHQSSVFWKVKKTGWKSSGNNEFHLVWLDNETNGN